MDRSWNDALSVRRRRAVANAFSRQAYRFEKRLPAIRSGAEARLSSERAGGATWLLAAKHVEFGHAIVGAYRAGRYGPAAALVRALFENTTLLAWMAIPDEAELQGVRVNRVLLDYYRRAGHEGAPIPPDAVALLKRTAGGEARKPPSWEDRVKQLDADKNKRGDGIAFWSSHVDHVAVLNDYVHAGLGGPVKFTDEMTRELLGFEALVYGHQYLSLGLVSVSRLSDQLALSDRGQAAFAHIHEQEKDELARLVRTTA